jgi:branched-chain amino acid aminotransferase
MAVAWFNGRLVDGFIPLDPADRGLTLGEGVFETVAVFNAHPAYLGPHLDRLEKGTEVLGIALSRSTIEQGISEIISAHRCRSGILRITATAGPGLRGLAASATEPTILITLAPWQEAMLNQPVKLATSAIRRNEHSPACRLKTLAYIDNILAAREAARAGADDALMLNTAGRPVCSTISNLFAIDGRALITPPVAEGALPGIMRARVLALAKSVDLDPVERPMTLADLHSAGAVFLTNSIRLTRPVTAIDNVQISQAASEPVQAMFDTLCREILRETGGDPRQADGTNL